MFDNRMHESKVMQATGPSLHIVYDMATATDQLLSRSVYELSFTSLYSAVSARGRQQGHAKQCIADIRVSLKDLRP